MSSLRVEKQTPNKNEINGNRTNIKNIIASGRSSKTLLSKSSKLLLDSEEEHSLKRPVKLPRLHAGMPNTK